MKRFFDYFVVCEEAGCDSGESYFSVAEMKKAGWKDVEKDPEGDLWTHVGLCPGCALEIKQDAEPDLFKHRGSLWE